MISNGNAIHNHWYLVSSHGAVLFYVAVNPGCTIKQIAEDMSLTQRTVWGLIGDLRRADMLRVRREGRRHHYTVNLDAAFRHPVITGISLRAVLGSLVGQLATAEREPAGVR
jgi:DNA-binding IclR family transcriptional regulator